MRLSISILFVVALSAVAPLSAQDAPAADSTAKDPLQEKLPLAPGRTVRTTATEGSWMSVDVSPDGSTLVFDLLGDLYTLPVEGGRATQLTRGMGFDAQPRFSPDGRHVVFTSDRDGGENLWILSTDLADTVQLTRGKHDGYLCPEWTPDGNYVVATKDSKLHMWHREGGGGVQLIEEPGNLRTVGAAFGADDRYIWFSGRLAQGSALQQRPGPVPAHGLRPGHRRAEPALQPLGRGHAPHAVSRRPLAGLRHPPHR